MTELVTGLAARLRSLWRGIVRRRDVEAEMAEEFAHHIELHTEELVRRGVPPAEAARQARVAFGHVGNHRADARAARGLGPVDDLRVSWLDVKLGLRMLVKYPGLSIVSVIGMSVAIAVAAGYFAVAGAMIAPAMPLHEGDRIVAIQNAVATSAGRTRQTFRDLAAWREQLRTVRDLGAFTSGPKNLLVPGRSAESVELARMTASGFRVTRTSPVLGRALLDEDERPGAAPVLVIAHEEWQRVFGGDPAVVGRRVRLGGDEHTVVGVMPAGFRFPATHRWWAPLRTSPAEAERGDGPSLFVFGRLADGATLESAQAELAVVGARMARAHPATHAELRPRVVPYTHPFSGLDMPAAAAVLRGVQVAIGLLLVLVSLNVAALVYARTATRAGEIAVRTALGASRRRVVTQLFAEALVLSCAAAVTGLAIAAGGLAWFERHMAGEIEDPLPFWIDLALTPGVVLYVAGLAIVGGVIVGVVPGLRATGRHVQASLQELSSRGSQGKLGRTWTTLIVVQVAIAVAVLPFAVHTAGKSMSRATSTPDFPAGELLRTSLWLEGEISPLPGGDSVAARRAFDARFNTAVTALVRRLEADPAVAAVTWASHFPGDEQVDRMEVERGEEGRVVRNSEVDPRLFAVFDARIAAGRAFTDADTRDSTTIVVDQLFVERALGGAPALGRRVRFLHRTERDEVRPGPWLEIVGVVPAFTASTDFDETYPRVYRPLALDAAPMGVHLAIRGRSGAMPALARRVRDVAAAVDPALQLDELQSAAEAERQSQRGALFVALAVSMVTASVLLLSATGVCAMMSFIVASRRREIGIRAALGADPRRLLASVFRRAGAQLGAGAAAGLLLAAVVSHVTGAGLLADRGALLLPTVAVLMLVVGLLAAIGPARRGLAVDPAEALREE